MGDPTNEERKDQERKIHARLGLALKELRCERRVTAETLGKALGVTQQQIYKMESGKNAISSARMILIATHFDVSIDALFAKGRAAIRHRDALFASNAFSRLADGLIARFLAIPNERQRDLVLALIQELAAQTADGKGEPHGDGSPEDEGGNHVLS